MEQKDRLIPLIKKQITIEKEHVKRITALEKKVRNGAQSFFSWKCALIHRNTRES